MKLEDILEDYDEEDTIIQTPYIHIYWQNMQHDDIVITANHEALIQLHRAITNAITKGEWHTPSVFCRDWEWYVIKVKDLWIGDLSGLDLPYSN